MFHGRHAPESEAEHPLRLRARLNAQHHSARIHADTGGDQVQTLLFRQRSDARATQLHVVMQENLDASTHPNAETCLKRPITSRSTQRSDVVEWNSTSQDNGSNFDDVVTVVMRPAGANHPGFSGFARVSNCLWQASRPCAGPRRPKAPHTR